MNDDFEGPIDGGMAFPGRIPIGKIDKTFAYFGGMSLRDYFAAKVIQGHLANPSTTEHPSFSREGLAAEAYFVADAMLAARGKV